MAKRVTLDEFLRRVSSKHNGKYDYSKVEWVNVKTKICIICPTHGEFWQTPHNHLNGQGCPECGRENTIKKQRKTKDEFIKKSIEIHNGKYDYSKVDYENAITKVCIICPEHGEFWQKPTAHQCGNGCPKCNKSNKLNNDEFIKKATLIHRNKYDYSKVEYKSNKTNVCIICPEHGEFWQRPNDHLNGAGCRLCNCHNHTKNFKDFENKANKVHNNKYSYVEDTYVNRANKTKIICPEHGEFWQKAVYHLQGNGCPKCGNKTNVSEQKVYFALLKVFPDEKIEYQYRNKELLGYMSFDIYFPKYKIAIEHQGIQHFEPIKRFGGVKKLKLTKERDIKKRNICQENDIRLFYISLDPKVSKYSTECCKIINNIDQLIDEIRRLRYE